MIPVDRDDLDVLAGEYVLGTLDAAAAAEVAAALPSNPPLRAAVEFWQGHLHPLTALTAPAVPDPANWDAIRARIAAPAGAAGARGARQSATWWRGVAAAAVVIAVGLAGYIASIPPSPGRVTVTLLRGPHESTARWVAVIAQNRLALRATVAPTLAAGRSYELWAIAPGKAAPEPLGVVARDGALSVPSVPSRLGAGTTLAISIEPAGGSPTGKPTGPVVFTGTVEAEL